MLSHQDPPSLSSVRQRLARRRPLRRLLRQKRPLRRERLKVVKKP